LKSSLGLSLKRRSSVSSYSSPLSQGLPARNGNGNLGGECREGPRQVRQGARLKAVVVVEGWNDKLAVLKAVDAEVVVLKGSNSVINREFKCSSEVIHKMEQAQGHVGGGPLIVLTDADTAGRQCRIALNNHFPSIRHAFISALQSMSNKQTRHHQAGNIGVEHAPPEVIFAALSNARVYSPNRKQFSSENLEMWGLAGSFGQLGVNANQGNISERRKKVGEALGFGNASGKAFLKCINEYGFEEDEIELAISRSENGRI